MEHESFVVTVMSVVALLFLAAISAVVTKRIRFPYTIGLVVIGVVVAFFADDYPDLAHALDELKLQPAMIMFLFIPILIFESAFKMDVPVLMRNLVPSLTLAGPGLLLSTAIVGVLIHLLTPLPMASALIFGGLISATDPVAVIALFKDVGAPKRLNILMEGESVFNDATAIVTVQIILAVIATGLMDTQTVVGGMVDFFAIFFGGLVVGIAFGWLVVRAIPWVGNQPLVHIMLTLVTAYGAFIVADHFLQASGIMAVLSAGLTIGYYGPSLYRQKVREYLEMFWEDAAFVANSLIFLMLGLSEKVFLAHTHNNPEGLLYPVLIAIAVVLVARFAVVYLLVPLLNRIPGAKPIDQRYRLVLAWGGLRGAVAIALAMSLPKHFPYRWQIIDFAFGVTLFTLLVNGTTMSWVIRRLKLDRPSPLLEYLGAYALVEAARGVLKQLQAYQPVMPVSEDWRQAVRATHEQELAQAERHLGELRERLADNPAKRRKLLWLQAFALQRETYHKRLQSGLLSRSSLQALEQDLKNMRIRVDNQARTAVEEQRLPADQRGSLAITGLLQQVLSGLPLLERWRAKHMHTLTEEATAVIAGAMTVTSQIDHLASFSGAEEQHMQECAEYYARLERMTRDRLAMLAQSYGMATEVMRARMVDQLTYDARSDVITALQRSGELPEELATQIQDRLEAEQEKRQQIVAVPAGSVK